MELRSLRCFVAVADAGTVTAGAADLGVGQPAVSRQLRQLERELRIDLFHREDGRLRLTAAGAEVLDEARAALDQAERVVRTARALASGRLSRVEIVSTGTTRDDVIAPWIAGWAETGPLVAVTERSVDAIYPALSTGEDLAVAPSVPPASLESRVVADVPLWACVAPGHPLARRAQVELRDLTGADLLLLDPTFHARRCLDDALDREGLAVDAVATFGSPVVAQAVAATGRGVCVLTDDPRFGLVPVGIVAADGPVGIRLYAAWDPRHHASEALAGLVEDLSRFTQSRYGSSASAG